MTWRCRSPRGSASSCGRSWPACWWAVDFAGTNPRTVVGGALLAPLLTPLPGMALAAVSGSARFFLRMIGTLAVACAAFLLIAGLAAGPGGILAFAHTRLNLVDFALLLAGALWMAVSLARWRGHTGAWPARRPPTSCCSHWARPGWACCGAIPSCGRAPH